MHRLLLALFICFSSLRVFAQDRAVMQDEFFNNVYAKFLYKPFPAMMFKDIHGNSWNSKELAGKPTFIRISKKDCLPCKIELSYFIELADSMKDCRFVYMTPDDTGAIVRSLKQAKNIIIIPKCKPELLEKYGISSGYPTSFYLDRNGAIVGGKIGGRSQYAYLSRKEWRSIFEELSR